jgi:enoyl-CoA hydratase
MDATPGIEVLRSGKGWATLVLDGSDRLHTLSVALRQSLDRIVRELEADPEVQVLILTARGRIFTAGLNLEEWEGGAGLAAGAFEYDAVASLRRFTGPVIGAIQGAAITGGLEIALACDLVVASSAASFTDTHVRVGLLPGWGGSVRLVRRIGLARAKELALTAGTLSAQQALDWGLVNHVVEPEELMALAESLASRMLQAKPEDLKAYKRLLDEVAGRSLDDALIHERREAMAFNARSTLTQIRARLARMLSLS